MTPRHFCVAGVALGDIHLDFTWQAWHNLTSTVVLRGRRGTNSHPPSFTWQAWHNLSRRGTYGTGWRAWTWFRRPWRPWRGATSAWQAWHLVTSTLISRGRRDTTSHLPSFCVAGVVHMALGGALGLGLGARDARDAAPLLRGRRGTWWHTLISRGRCGTIAHPRSLCVAGVAQTHIHRPFTWQAWHNLTSTVVLRGRRGTHGTGWRAWTWFRRPWRPWRRATSAWQAWHLVTSTLISRGRRGTIAHPRSFCVAGVAQTHIHRPFTWQAWHNLTSTVVLRGRRGTHGTGWRAWTWFRRPWRPWRRATSAWQAWHLVTSTLISCGRRGTTSRLPSFCVAGVATTSQSSEIGHLHAKMRSFRHVSSFRVLRHVWFWHV